MVNKMSYEIHQSIKTGITTKESYTVTRGRTLYLRIIGQYPNYIMMTATASEDNNRYIRCEKKEDLMSAALMLGNELKTNPENLRDRYQREYISICRIEIKQEHNKNSIMEGLDQIITRFFSLYDSKPSSKEQEMKNLYNELSIIEGEDVYLSDGMWLRPDGEITQR